MPAGRNNDRFHKISILLGKGVFTSAALYRKSYIEGLEWDPDITKLADWDWFVRAALRKGKIVSLNAISYWVRQHKGGRITSNATMLINDYNHHKILNKIENILQDNEALTSNRKKRLAQYYYKELRVLCLYDQLAFKKAVNQGH